MLSPEIVVIDFEGFRHKKSGFIIKELSICSNNYSDTVLFLPPISFNSLSSSERKSHQWISKQLHGISWDSGSYPYWFLSQIFIAIKIRFPTAKFYKGEGEDGDTAKTPSKIRHKFRNIAMSKN